jgi:hypothetical protein
MRIGAVPVIVRMAHNIWEGRKVVKPGSPSASRVAHAGDSGGDHPKP